MLIWLKNQGKGRYRTFQLRYPDVPRFSARCKEGKSFTANPASGNAQCVLRDQLPVKAFDIDGERVKKLKVSPP